MGYWSHLSKVCHPIGEISFVSVSRASNNRKYPSGSSALNKINTLLLLWSVDLKRPPIWIILNFFILLNKLIHKLKYPPISFWVQRLRFSHFNTFLAENPFWLSHDNGRLPLFTTMPLCIYDPCCWEYFLHVACCVSVNLNAMWQCFPQDRAVLFVTWKLMFQCKTQISQNKLMFHKTNWCFTRGHLGSPISAGQSCHNPLDQNRNQSCTHPSP